MLGCGWKYRVRVLTEPMHVENDYAYEVTLISKSLHIFGIKVYTKKL